MNEPRCSIQADIVSLREIQQELKDAALVILAQIIAADKIVERLSNGGAFNE